MVSYEIIKVESENGVFFYSEIIEGDWFVKSPLYTSYGVCSYETMKACIRVKEGMSLERTVRQMKLDPMVP